MLAGVLLATWGYIHDEDMSWRFGIIEDVLDFVVPLLFLVGMTGLYALGKGWVGRLGGAGFILGGVGTAWGFLDGVFDVPLWYFFWHTYFPRQGWLLGAVNWVSFLSGGLVLVGLALIWTRALRRWGDLVFGMGAVGLVYAFTETGDATATRLVHVAFGVVFSLGWVTFGYALFRSVGNRQSDISHVGRSFNLSGRFYWPSRFPKLLNRPIVLLISVVLLLTISGSLLYDRYESSLQHDSNTTAIQPDTPEVDTAQNEEAATFPEQEPATTKGTPSEAINAYPAEAPSDLRVVVRVVDAPTWLVVQEDGQITLEQEGQLGFLREFEASQEFSIWTGNAGATWVEVNGYDLGPLGASGEFATRTFTEGAR